MVSTKLRPCGPNSHDERTIACTTAGRVDGELARELGTPVGASAGAADRPPRYGSRPVAVEDVVGRDVHDERAGLGGRGGHVAGAGAVDGGRRGLGGLGAVDVGPGGAVDHGVGAGGADGRAHGVGVGDVEVGPGQGGDLVAGVRCGRHHIACPACPRPPSRGGAWQT